MFLKKCYNKMRAAKVFVAVHGLATPAIFVT